MTHACVLLKMLELFILAFICETRLLQMCDMTHWHDTCLHFSGSVGILFPAFIYDFHWYVRNDSLTWFMPAFFWKRWNDDSMHSYMSFIDMCKMLIWLMPAFFWKRWNCSSACSLEFAVMCTTGALRANRFELVAMHVAVSTLSPAFFFWVVHTQLNHWTKWHWTKWAANTQCIYIRDVTLSYMRQDSFICVTRLLHTCDITHSCVRHESCTLCNIWTRTLVCGITHLTPSYVRHDDMAHLYMRHDSFICETWLMHTFSTSRHSHQHCAVWRECCSSCMCDTTHTHVRHDSFICET